MSSRKVEALTQVRGGWPMSPVPPLLCLRCPLYLSKCDLGLIPGHLNLWAGPPLTQPASSRARQQLGGRTSLCHRSPLCPGLAPARSAHATSSRWYHKAILGPESKQPLLGGLTQ